MSQKPLNCLIYLTELSLIYNVVLNCSHLKTFFYFSPSIWVISATLPVHCSVPVYHLISCWFFLVCLISAVKKNCSVFFAFVFSTGVSLTLGRGTSRFWCHWRHKGLIGITLLLQNWNFNISQHCETSRIFFQFLSLKECPFASFHSVFTYTFATQTWTNNVLLTLKVFHAPCHCQLSLL